MWDDDRKTLSAQLRSSTAWMDATKSSSTSSSSPTTNQRSHINNLSNRINRSSPSINLIVNSDDDDYTILPPSPPINRTPYSRIKVKARSRSSSRARFETLESTSEGPTSMIQERQSTNHHHNQLNHNNYHSGGDFSSFDCYQFDGNRKMVNRSKTLNGSDHNLYHVGANVIRKNRENIYEILTSKKFMDTQKTIGSCNILNGEVNGGDDNGRNNLIKSQSTQLLPVTSKSPTRGIIDQLDGSIIDANNLMNDDLIEKEWNKLVNGTCGNSLIRPVTPSNGRKLIAHNQSSSSNHNLNSLTTIKPPSGSLSLSSLPITPKSSSTPPTTTKVNKLNEVNQVNQHHNQLDGDDHYEETNNQRNERKELINEESNRTKLINLFNNMSKQFDQHRSHQQLTNNYHLNGHNNNNYDDKSNLPGTRFKEILKLYENLGKCSMFTDTITTSTTVTPAPTVVATEAKRKPKNMETIKKSIEPINGSSDDAAVDHQQLKSTILQLDSVCQTRLRTLEECQRKIVTLRDELRSKEEENVSLRAESDSLAGQLEEARNGWKCEIDRRLAEGERYKKVTGKLYARLDELNRELQESHINYDYLEMAYNRLRAEVSRVQEVHSAEINLMRDRLNDLTSKLITSEKSLKNAKSYIGKLESRKRRGSSMRSSSRPNSTGSCNVGSGNTDGKERDGKSGTSSVNGTASGPKSKNKESSTSTPCIPKDFQHKLQELEVKIARIQVILSANEHQSPDEGLPDIESINSFPSSLPDHHLLVHHRHHRHPPSQIIEISSSPPTTTINNNNTIDSKLSPTPVKVETVSSTSSLHNQVNSSQSITINNENNLVTTR